MKDTTKPQTIAAALVDELAQVKAEAAELATREADIKRAIIALGLPSIEGTQHRATVSTVDRAVTDWRAIAERLKASRQLIAAHTKITAPVTSIRLHARKEAK